MNEKRGRGRPRGSPNKPKPVDLSFTRVKELFGSCYSPTQQKKRFMRLKPDQQFRLIAMLEPKQRPTAAEEKTIVKFLTFGIRASNCPHEGCDVALTLDVLDMILLGTAIKCPGCGGEIPLGGKNPVAIPPEMVTMFAELGKGREKCDNTASQDFPKDDTRAPRGYASDSSGEKRKAWEERAKAIEEHKKEQEKIELRKINKALMDRGLPIWNNLQMAREAVKAEGIFLDFPDFKID